MNWSKCRSLKTAIKCSDAQCPGLAEFINNPTKEYERDDIQRFIDYTDSDIFIGFVDNFQSWLADSPDYLIVNVMVSMATLSNYAENWNTEKEDDLPDFI